MNPIEIVKDFLSSGTRALALVVLTLMSWVPLAGLLFALSGCSGAQNQAAPAVRLPTTRHAALSGSGPATVGSATFDAPVIDTATWNGTPIGTGQFSVPLAPALAGGPSAVASSETSAQGTFYYLIVGDLSSPTGTAMAIISDAPFALGTTTLDPAHHLVAVFDTASGDPVAEAQSGTLTLTSAGSLPGSRVKGSLGATFQAIAAPGCTSSSQCAAGEVCLGGACVASPVCTSNAQCPSGEICLSGACVVGCTSNAQCAPGELCQAGACVAIPGCTSNAQCAPGELCLRGACVAAGCTSNAQCSPGELCVSGACIAAGCTSSAQCAPGELCQSGVCVSIPGCTSSAQCTPDELCLRGTCVAAGCTSSAQCSAGQVCQSGVCVSIPGCTSSAQCSPGLVCQSGRCVPSTPPAGCQGMQGAATLTSSQGALSTCSALGSASVSLTNAVAMLTDSPAGTPAILVLDPASQDQGLELDLNACPSAPGTLSVGSGLEATLYANPQHSGHVALYAAFEATGGTVTFTQVGANIAGTATLSFDNGGTASATFTLQ